jgi:hypothetical protein
MERYEIFYKQSFVPGPEWAKGLHWDLCGATIWVRSASIRMRTDCRGATGMACLFVAGKIYVSA